MDRISGDYTWTKNLQDGAKHYAEERGYLTNLLLHTSGHDSFIQYMAENNCRVFTKHLSATLGQEKLDEKTALLARTYCLGTGVLFRV